MGKGFLHKGTFHGIRLRGQMQSFALAVAKLCVGSCNALRWHMQCFASGMGKTGTEEEGMVE